MKNLTKFLGIIAIVAIIGLFAGCGDGGGGGSSGGENNNNNNNTPTTYTYKFFNTSSKVVTISSPDLSPSQFAIMAKTGIFSATSTKKDASFSI